MHLNQELMINIKPQPNIFFKSEFAITKIYHTILHHIDQKPKKTEGKPKKNWRKIEENRSEEKIRGKNSSGMKSDESAVEKWGDEEGEEEGNQIRRSSRIEEPTSQTWTIKMDQSRETRTE